MKINTACELCDHVHPDTMKLHPARWLCMKFPRLEGFSPVAPLTWVDKEPYMRCIGINGGACPLFERRRDGQKELIGDQDEPLTATT